MSWTHQHHGRAILNEEGQQIAEIHSGAIGPEQATQVGCLIAAAPELLDLAEKFLRETIALRDSLYEGCSDDQGEVPLEEDREALAYYDALIDRIRATLATAKGENAWAYRMPAAETSLIDHL